MSSIEKGVLAAVLTALLASPLVAQTNTSRIPLDYIGETAWPGPPLLILNRGVLRALQLTPVQRERFTTTSNLLRMSLQSDLGQLGLSAVSDDAAQRNSLIRNYDRRLLNAAFALLTPQQIQRYRQIELQSRGLSAFADPQMQKDLHLTNDQIRRLQALSRKPPTLGQATIDQVNDVLTPDQRPLWRDKVGEPYHF